MSVEKIKDKMTEIASMVLEVPEEDIFFANSEIVSRSRKADDPKKKVSFEKIAGRAYQPTKLPKGMESVLFAFSSFAPTNFTYPFGTHIAVVEIDPETGRLKILDYTSVDDCGKVINPMIVEGQIHGGIAQGLGQALLEEVRYDENGQLLSSSFLDYQIPLAEDLQAFTASVPRLQHTLIRSGSRVSAKRVRSGTPVLANAVRDALSVNGVKVEKMPFSLDYVWSLASVQEKN